MPVRLFVGNLPYEITEEELREFFAPIGPLAQVFIPVDRETGKRRGFAFVEFDDRAQAEEAIRQLNSRQLKGRPVSVNEARPKDAAGPRTPPASPRGEFRHSSAVPFAPSDPGFAPPARRFGPDAKPARARKQSRRPQGEERKKGPIRERRGGQLFGIDDGEDDYDTADWRSSSDAYEEEDLNRDENDRE
jgi:RNA recognition motif-containing protein